METKFNFKSAICTSLSQSERLLALGLKKETADMHWAYHSVTATRYVVAHPCDGVGECIPSWSLHRLIELKQPNTIDNAIVVLSREQTYDKLIGMIAKSIKEGYFNKEYLVDLTGTDSHQDMVDAIGYAIEVMKAKKEE